MWFMFQRTSLPARPARIARVPAKGPSKRILQQQEMNMAQAETVEVLILGSGEGGKYLAWHMASSGRRTAVVERKWIGGSCPNINCLPSKNEIWSAKIVDLVHHAVKAGLLNGSPVLNMLRVRQRKRDMVEGLIAMHLEKYRASGAELIMGAGRFVAPKTLEVQLNAGGTRLLKGEKVFLNLGTHATIPPIPGLADAQPITNIELLELDRAPATLIVLGGGYVGLEFAQALRRFGSQVTVIEHGPQLLGREDADVAEEIRRLLQAEEIQVLCGTDVLQVEGRSGEAVRLRVKTSTGEQTVSGSDLLVATGRTPNTTGIGLEEVGVQLDGRGYIKVNDRLETTAAGIWAIGECAGSPQFTHVSLDDFRIIRDNLAGGRRSTRDRLVPYCLFTDPPLARVGLSEREARQRGIAVRVARVPASAVLRTRTSGETAGFMKVLVEAAGDHILGFTMIGQDAGEVMAAVQTAILGGLSWKLFRDAILAHPTMAEGLNALFAAVPA
jgi:pyruvate/2-oxoglutarate dehydrogenase complex dihydrolipoamide dehydrogenase (E3) component